MSRSATSGPWDLGQALKQCELCFCVCKMPRLDCPTRICPRRMLGSPPPTPFFPVHLRIQFSGHVMPMNHHGIITPWFQMFSSEEKPLPFKPHLPDKYQHQDKRKERVRWYNGLIIHRLRVCNFGNLLKVISQNLRTNVVTWGGHRKVCPRSWWMPLHWAYGLLFHVTAPNPSCLPYWKC